MSASDVDAWLAALPHARKPEIERLRALILDAEPALSEHVKWNAPSFVHDGEDRLTMRLKPGDRVELILHRGTKPKSAAGFAFSTSPGWSNGWRPTAAGSFSPTPPISTPSRTASPAWSAPGFASDRQARERSGLCRVSCARRSRRHR